MDLSEEELIFVIACLLIIIAAVYMLHSASIVSKTIKKPAVKGGCPNKK